MTMMEDKMLKHVEVYKKYLDPTKETLDKKFERVTQMFGDLLGELYGVIDVDNKKLNQYEIDVLTAEALEIKALKEEIGKILDIRYNRIREIVFSHFDITVGKDKEGQEVSVIMEHKLQRQISNKGGELDWAALKTLLEGREDRKTYVTITDPPVPSERVPNEGKLTAALNSSKVKVDDIEKCLTPVRKTSSFFIRKASEKELEEAQT